VALCAKAGTEILLSLKDIYSIIKVDFTTKTIYVLQFVFLNKVSVSNSDLKVSHMGACSRLKKILVTNSTSEHLTA
jgi:hypothetical protein